MILNPLILHDDMPFPSLEQEGDLLMSLSPDLAPTPSSHKNIANGVLIYADPPALFNDSCKFERHEQFDTVSELDMSITHNVEHYDIDESETIYLQESREEKV